MSVPTISRMPLITYSYADADQKESDQAREKPMLLWLRMG